MADTHAPTPFIRLSVLLCVRNGERFLRPALDSVLRQQEPLPPPLPTLTEEEARGATGDDQTAVESASTLPDAVDDSIEFVVVDDGSTDSTPAILREYAEKGQIKIQWTAHCAQRATQCP